MYSEVYKCDREGCKNSTGAIMQSPDTLNPVKYPFKDDTWIRRNTIENGEIKERDFCSLECEAVWLDGQLKNKIQGDK